MINITNQNGSWNAKGVHHISFASFCVLHSYQAPSQFGSIGSILKIPDSGDDYIKTENECLQAAKDIFKSNAVIQIQGNGAVGFFIP